MSQASRQIDSDTAAALGLLSHTTLVAPANGELKIDYLCAATIQILGVEASLVLKVSPGQPSNVLGLDAMFVFGVEVNMLALQFSIAEAPLPIPMVAAKFRWLHWDAILHSRHLTLADLVPIADLPPPADSFRELVNVGKPNLIINLGTARPSGTLPRCAWTSMIDLGTS